MMDMWIDLESLDETGYETGREMIIFGSSGEGRSYYSPPLTDIYLYPMDRVSAHLDAIEHEHAYDRAMGVL